MAKKSAGVPADLLVAVTSDPAPRRAVERVSQTLRAIDVSRELAGASAALIVQDAALCLDPMRLGMGVHVGAFSTPEPVGTHLAAQALAESSARIAREAFSGYSLVASAIAEFATSTYMGELVRQVRINAAALAASAGPFILSDYAKLSAAAQVAEALRGATIDAVALAIPWTELVDHRRRVRRWLGELGSDDDPTSVELVEIDGSELGRDLSACWFAFLGERIEGWPSGGQAQVMTFGDTTLMVWGIRIYHDDTDTFVEIRNPPWGTGEPDIRRYDPFRPAASLRVLRGLRALGYERQRGRRALAELWGQEEFHRAYRRAEAVVRARRAGKRGSQLEIAGELGMSDRHLRRLIDLHGLPE